MQKKYAYFKEAQEELKKKAQGGDIEMQCLSAVFWAFNRSRFDFPGDDLYFHKLHAHGTSSKTLQ